MAVPGDRVRWVACVIGYSGFVYSLLLLFLMASEERLLYPRGGRPIDAGTLRYEEVWLTTEDALRLHAWFCPAPETHRTGYALLFCHGNAGELSSRAFLAERWGHVLGVDVLLFDYRGYGRSEGTPHEQGLYTDAAAAHQWLQSRGYLPDRIIIAGRSLGGAVALQLATRVHPAALILESTFTSAPEVAAEIYPFLPVAPLMRNRYPNIQRITDYAGPIFLSHGQMDTLIPVSHAQKLYEAAPGPKQLLLFPDLGHNEPPPISYYHAVQAFLADHLQSN